MKHECGLDVTYCDDCGDELEVGQVGQCDDCQPPKEYTFAELSEKAKEAARDAHRYTEHYPGYEWWDNVYDDAARVATILGIDLMKTERTSKGRSYQTQDINFSGFCSQGDGACFRGSYHFNPKVVDEIKAYCNDEELIRIATELYTLQLARRLRGLEPFRAGIETSGRSSHSGAMNIEVYVEEDEGAVDSDLEAEVTQIMRDFADWIYKSLEAEHDYLMSDACVDEQLREENFDEDGNTI